MKARTVLELSVNPLNAPPQWSGNIVPVEFAGKIDWRIPEGTVIEGEQALFMCRTGQCEPIDDECIESLDIPAERRAVLQLNYKMSSLGINSKEDRELYRAGVILGYDDSLKYIPGPNWDAYQQARKKAKQQDEDI